MHRVFVAALIFAIAGQSISPTGALAAPPSNDAPGAATVISGLPFSEFVDLAEATTEDPEFPPCESIGRQRVWYAYAPSADETISVSAGGNEVVEIALWRVGSGPLDLTLVGCGVFGRDLVGSVVAGTGYLISIGMWEDVGSFAGTVTFTSVPPPANDDLAGALDISELFPYSEVIARASAIASSFETAEPVPSCGIGDFGPPTHSVWYRVSLPTAALLLTNESQFEFLAVYEGTGFADAVEIGCINGGWGVVSLAATGSYLIQVGPYRYRDTWLDLRVTLPPPNDAFDAPVLIDALPFTAWAPLTYATTEANEPVGCGWGGDRSTWYEWTAPTDASMLLSLSDYSAFAALYTGETIGSLTEVLCMPGYTSPTMFQAQAGATYRVQVGSYNGYEVLLQLQETPPPAASLSFWPFQPSSFDTIQFYDASSDPASQSWTRTWDFGDGATSTDATPSHRYATDGTYPVTLSIETSDGRTDTASYDLVVQTHDIAIKRLAAPVSAAAGQSRQITVAVANNRYPETVTVVLWAFRGQESFYLGDITKLVPVRGANRTTDFVFTYRFTSADAAYGKLTFRAYANFSGFPDVVPADNEMLATTKVTR